MKLSFIIPSYNQGRFIKNCLDSIDTLSKEVEVLVMDGGSSDETVDVIRQHPLVTEWVSEPDSGQAHAVNKGLERCTGDLIFWINSDDYYLPGAINALVEYFDDHPETRIVYGAGHHVDEFNEYLYDYKIEPWDYQRLLDICFLCQPSVVFRRSVYEEFGGLDERFHFALDLEYWLRIGKKYRFSQVNFPIAASRLWGDTKSTLRQFEMQEEALRLSYFYGNKWSKRRFWALVENWIFERSPQTQKSTIRYWMLRISYASRLKRATLGTTANLMSDKLICR